MSSNIAEWLSYRFSVFVPEKGINGAVLRENPVSVNTQRLKELRDYLIKILREKREHSTVIIDSVLEKLQKYEENRKELVSFPKEPRELVVSC